jgi:hypothetical protein
MVPELKNFDWDSLNRLQAKDLISNPVSKAKIDPSD